MRLTMEYTFIRQLVLGMSVALAEGLAQQQCVTCECAALHVRVHWLETPLQDSPSSSLTISD